MLRNNILSSQYFKDLFVLRSLQEVIGEIEKNVSYTEPWVLGANSVPSSLFCCLYKLMLMHLTERQVQTLLKYRGNPFVRACGALFVRFLSPHEQLWERFASWLLDE
jgi:pre-mRNA-splicing factor 38B